MFANANNKRECRNELTTNINMSCTFQYASVPEITYYKYFGNKI